MKHLFEPEPSARSLAHVRSHTRTHAHKFRAHLTALGEARAPCRQSAPGARSATVAHNTQKDLTCVYCDAYVIHTRMGRWPRTHARTHAHLTLMWALGSGRDGALFSNTHFPGAVGKARFTSAPNTDLMVYFTRLRHYYCPVYTRCVR